MDPVTLLFVCGLSQTTLSQPCKDQGRDKRAQLFEAPTAILQRPFSSLNAQYNDKIRFHPWADFITEAAARFAVPEDWIKAVMRAESGGHAHIDGMPTTSQAGAMGLMQLMPDTYETMRLRYGLGPDPYDPHDNILAGVAYLREMFDRYGAPLFLAAYNAGPRRIDRFLLHDKALPMETQTYVMNVGAAIQLNEESIRLTRAVQASVPNSSPETSIENGARVANKFVVFPSDMMPKSSVIFRPLARDITSNTLRNESVLFVPLSRATD